MNEWKSFRLDELADIRISNVDKKSKPGEKPVRLCNYMDVYSNDYITSSLGFMESTASSVECGKFKVDEGDVLITKDSETPYDIGISSVVVDKIEDLVCGYHLALMKPNRNMVNPVFLSKQLASVDVSSYFSRMAAGSTRYGLSNGTIGRTRILIPPLLKQNKIAHVLRTFDQTIEKTEALIEKNQQIKAGLMHDLFTRGIGADGNLRPPREQAPELYQQTLIGWIPNEWKMMSLSALSTLITKGATPTTYGYEYVTESDEGCARFLRATNATPEGRYRDPDPRFISAAANQLLSRSQLESGDTVMSIVGARVGTSFSVDPTILPANINQNVALIRPDQSRVFPAYISLCVTSFLVQNEILILATTQAQPSLSLRQVGDICVPLPSLAEQAQILDKTTSIITRLDSLITEKSKLMKIKSGLMLDLLTGKVQVKVSQTEAAHV